MKAKFLVQITHCSKELDNILGSFQNDAIWHNVPFQIILVNLVNVGVPCLKLVISIPYRKHFIGNSCQIRINKQELFKFHIPCEPMQIPFVLFLYGYFQLITQVISLDA